MPLTPFLNNTNGISQPIPGGILPLPGPFGAQYQRSDIAFDYAIAGVPFIGGESLRGSYFRKIYQRSFSPIRKDQFDNQQVPGEQSIWGWWLRSQSDFHLGAGIQFLDTTQDPTLAQRYAYSEGLDMLGTPGQVTLLPACQEGGGSVGAVSTIGPTKLRTVTKGGVDGVLVFDTGARTLKYVNIQGTITNYTMPAAIGGQTVMNTFTDDGSNYYFMTSGGIYKGSIANNGVAATVIWNPPTGTTFFGTLNWVKGRLVAGWTSYNGAANVAASVYELVGAGPALPTPKFTHQNPDYVFTDISEIGPAILVSGHAFGNLSQVHRFTLDSGGAMPTLTSGAVALQMPYGEKILSMYAYIGYFVGLGTNRGFRVATADTNGNLVYGPLVFQDPLGVGVQAISGYDRFMFAGNQANTMIPQQGWANPADASTTDMLIRVDLSSVTSTNSQPFANDLQSPNAATGSPINSIAPIGQTGLLMWTTGSHTYWSSQGAGTTYQNASRLASGFMYTPKIRYNTLEPKHFKFVYARHQNITGAAGLDIYGLTANASVPNIIALNINGNSSAGAAMPFGIGDLGNAQEWFQLKFVLHGGTFTNLVFNGYQMRALPGVSRQILIEVPLLCLDHETDRYGVLHGYDGYAWSRIQAIESLMASGNVVLFQDLNYNTSNLVVVDDYRFEQQSPELAKTSSAGNQDSNAHGGYIILQCRVIA
jgi:hypothetical protein